MKIIHVTPAYKPAYIYGGPTMSVAKLCEALAESSADIEVLTTTANGKGELDVTPGEQIFVDGVPVTYFKRLTKDHTHFSPALLIALWRRIKSKKQGKRTEIASPATQARNDAPHNIQHTTRNTQLIIHIHSWWNLVALLSALIAKIYKVPVFLSPRGMLTSYTQNNKNSFFKSAIHFLMGKSLLRYSHIIASSEKEKADVLQIITPKSMTVIPNLVDLPIQPTIRNPQPTTHNPQPFKLLFLSRIEEKKGLDILFQALARLNIPWQLTLAGSGEPDYINSLKETAANLNIANKIAWIGHVSNQDKFELMAKHDLFVLTSYNENFANVVIECLSVGTPVLLSKSVGLSSYVAKENLGFVCESDPEAITNTISSAFSEHTKREAIRSKAPGKIRTDFDTDHLTATYLNYYKSILNIL